MVFSWFSYGLFPTQTTPPFYRTTAKRKYTWKLCRFCPFCCPLIQLSLCNSPVSQPVSQSDTQVHPFFHLSNQIFTISLSLLGYTCSINSSFRRVKYGGFWYTYTVGPPWSANPLSSYYSLHLWPQKTLLGGTQATLDLSWIEVKHWSVQKTCFFLSSENEVTKSLLLCFPAWLPPHKLGPLPQPKWPAVPSRAPLC